MDQSIFCVRASSDMQSSATDPEKYIQKCTVAVLDTAQEGIRNVLGTGFIVTTDGLVITCYHVIKGIIENGEENNLSSCTVGVYFPVAKTTKRAKVIKEYSNEKQDIAFLRLEEQLPANGTAVAFLSKNVVYAHKFKNYGFLEPRHYVGLFATSEIIGEVRKVLYKDTQDVLELKSEPMGPGMSGSALLDLQTKRVVGVIFEQLTGDNKIICFAISVKSIISSDTDVSRILKKENPGLAEDLVVMNLSAIFKSAPTFLFEFQQIFEKPEFQEELSKAGGLLSLIVIVSNLCGQMKGKGQNSEERTFNSLIGYIFETTREILEKTFKQIIEKESAFSTDLNQSQLRQNLDKNQDMIRNSVLEPFKEYVEWECYLPDHPSIDHFRRNIISYLRQQNVDIVEINDFVAQFNVLLDYKVSGDDEIKEYYRWWTHKEDVKNLVAYLEEVRTNQNFIADCDRKPLRDYYVENKAFIGEIESWEISDESLKNADYVNENNIDEPFNIIKNDLLDHNGWEWYWFIGGTFGIGKSALSRILASTIAQDYLQNPNVELEDSNTESYIPILIQLRTYLRNITVSKLGLLDNILRLIYPENPQFKKNKNVLLILDGLNDYPEEVDSLIADLEYYRSTYSTNIKVIITTRVSPDTSKLKTSISRLYTHSKFRYIRLLPFTKDQVNCFFDKFGVKENITYELAITSLRWDEHNVKTPLFSWMLALIYATRNQTIKARQNWNKQISSTLIYFYFLHNVIRPNVKREGTDYKGRQILRIIAALKHIYKDTLIVGDDEKGNKVTINKEISKFDPSLNPEDVEAIYKPYQSQQGYSGTEFNFVHQSFGEYLVAEYYLDVLLDGKMHRFNVGVPSKESIQFLEGLIYLLKDKDTRYDVLEEFKAPNDTHDHIEYIRRIIRNASDSVINDSIAFLNLTKKDTEAIWTNVNIDNKNYKDLWIHRWLSLLVLNDMIDNNIFPEEEQNERIFEIKEKLVELIVCSAKLDIPNYLIKLNNFDLSDANLIECNLSGADLSNNKKLAFSNFFYAKLTYANFSDTDLFLANFWRANLKNTKFIKANLYGANFYLAEIRGSDLSSADMTYAELSGANLARSKLSYAHLCGANLSGADLSGADLCGADLSGADLSGANLSDASMFAIEKYDNLKCDNANFTNIRTNIPDLLNVLKRSSGTLSIKDNTSKGSTLLTGAWRSNDGGIYYMHQIGNTNTVWSLGVSNAGNFANIFKGVINHDIIDVEWADVPLGEDLDHGTLKLKIKNDSDEIILLKIEQTGGFGATIWKRIKDLPLPLNKEYKLRQFHQTPPLPENNKKLTGIWKSIQSANVEITYYVHQIENTVWTCGIRKSGNFAQVSKGIIMNDVINGEWADVYREDKMSFEHGISKLKIDKSGNEVISFKDHSMPTLIYYRIG